MPFPLKSALVVTSLAVGGLVYGIGFHGNEDQDQTQLQVDGDKDDSSVIAGPLLEYKRHDGSVLSVMGPTCYDDGLGNDVVLHSTPQAQTDCFVLRNGGVDLLDLSRREEAAYIRISSQPNSQQNLRLPKARSVIEVDGNFNILLDAPLGSGIVIALPQLNVPEITFKQEGDNVILMTDWGNISIVDQLNSANGGGPVDALILSNGAILNKSQIQVQSVVSQGTPGDDTIRGTNGDDVLFPGLGNDQLILLDGTSRIHYEGGNDRIRLAGEGESQNELYIPFLREEVSMRPSEDARDVVIETPNGTISLVFQMFYPLGDKRVPIDKITFNDGPVDEEGIRFLAESFMTQQTNTSNTDRTRLRN